jgi:carbamoyltransferase
MLILGISALYHDSAACLIKDGKIIAAAQEERFTRKKHDHSFPSNAIQYCLRETDIGVTELDYITFYDKPFLKFERILETYLAFAPIIIFLVLFSLVIVLTEGSAIAPFIYTLF